MFAKRMAWVPVLAALGSAPAATALADNGLVGGIIGGIIGGAIVNEATRNNSSPRTTTTVNTAQREMNREVQVALNHFGFDTGTPDGVLGQRSRSAIANYQALLGYPPTGQLSEYERAHLVGSYHRAVAGGALTLQQAAVNPLGLKGLLVTWRDEAFGAAPAPGLITKAPEPNRAAPEPVPVAEPAPVPAAPMLPNFMGGAAVQASLASHCNKVSLVTSTNGGFTTLASMSDPNQALGEQFCLARTYAIAQGEELAAKIANVGATEIAAQCASFGPALNDHVTALSLRSRGEVIGGVASFALASGMAPAQLAGTAKICLSVGYRTDDLGVAIGSALLLSALGERVYDELLGHHLAMGFGAAARPDLALDWYQSGIDALSAGGIAVFAPGQPERTELIRRAAYTIGGRSDLLAPAAPVPATLPNFAVTPAPAPVPQVAVAPTPVPAPVPVAAPVPVPAPLPAPATAPAPAPVMASAAQVPADTAPPSAQVLAVSATTPPVDFGTGVLTIFTLPALIFR